eukprot:8030574-Lingulodinium_polyedra.AAC.1
MRFDLVVGHGPPSCEKNRVAEWWPWCTGVLESRPAPHAPLILMIDANARVGASPDESIGSHAAEHADAA